MPGPGLAGTFLEDGAFHSWRIWDDGMGAVSKYPLGKN